MATYFSQNIYMATYFSHNIYMATYFSQNMVSLQSSAFANMSVLCADLRIEIGGKTIGGLSTASRETVGQKTTRIVF